VGPRTVLGGREYRNILVSANDVLAYKNGENIQKSFPLHLIVQLKLIFNIKIFGENYEL